MKRLSMLTVALVVVIGLWGGTCLGAENLKQLSTGGITVSYPDGMDAQAKRVMAIAQATIKPSIEVHRQTVALLSNVDSMSTDIAQALGADEKQDRAKMRLQSFRDKSAALVASFSNIKLVRKASAIATDGIDAGLMQVRYAKDKDEFSMVFDEKDTSPDKIKRSFFPVLVNGDGTVRSESKLGQMALDFLGSGEAMAIAPVQDTISYLIAEPLKIYNPFSRWFNEGVSGYLTRQMVAKYGSKQLNTLATSLFTVNSNTQELKSKVNLISWPQVPYQNRDAASFDPKLEAARAQYAIEAISNVLATAGPKALAKIMNGVSYSGNPDTDTICAAIQKATGTDFKSILMTYVPKDVRDGMASGEAAKLVTRAEALVGQKKWTDAAAALRQALEMTPQDANTRLNLAWIEREFGERKDSELQVFLTAGILKQQKHTFHLFAASIEGNYVSGRLAIMMGNLEAAKEFLQPVLELSPGHADAKRAMEEIEKLEAAAKGKS